VADHGHHIIPQRHNPSQIGHGCCQKIRRGTAIADINTGSSYSHFLKIMGKI